MSNCDENFHAKFLKLLVLIDFSYNEYGNIIFGKKSFVKKKVIIDFLSKIHIWSN